MHFLVQYFFPNKVQVYNGFLKEVKQSDGGDVDVKRLQPFTPEPIQRYIHGMCYK